MTFPENFSSSSKSVSKLSTSAIGHLVPQSTNPFITAILSFQELLFVDPDASSVAPPPYTVLDPVAPPPYTILQVAKEDTSRSVQWLGIFKNKFL
jgi:hypothetical protein